MRLISVLLASLFLTTACSAGQADIQSNLEARFPGAKVKSVSSSPIAGVFEVITEDNQIIYSDDKADFILIGEMMDTKNRRSLTKEKQDDLMRINFDDLPLAQAIKTVKGKGERRIAVFSDVDCPFCKRLEPELAKLDNVTIYTFLYPLPMHGDAPRKSKAIWCSKDRVQAWDDLMLRGKEPANANTDCENPIDANLALGQKLGVEGTPAIILSDGRRIPGFARSQDLEPRIAQASAGKAAK